MSSFPLASPRRILVTSVTTLAVALLMFAFGYAMVPLYYKLCAALGIEVSSSEQHAATVAPPPPRPVRVEFDTNSHNEIVAMVPTARTTELATGTAQLISYTITNLTDQPVVGRAVPSYAPARSTRWFNKLRCFCFDEVRLAPGEVRTEPVVFLLERDLPEDIEVVSLAYTFFVNEHGGHEGHDG